MRLWTRLVAVFCALSHVLARDSYFFLSSVVSNIAVGVFDCTSAVAHVTRHLHGARLSARVILSCHFNRNVFFFAIFQFLPSHFCVRRTLQTHVEGAPFNLDNSGVNMVFLLMDCGLFWKVAQFIVVSLSAAHLCCVVFSLHWAFWLKPFWLKPFLSRWVCFGVNSFERHSSMGRRGWQAIEVPQLWFNVIRGPHPPSVATGTELPSASEGDAQCVSCDTHEGSWGSPSFCAKLRWHSSSKEWSSSHSRGGHGACTPCNTVGVSHAVVGCRRDLPG